MKGIKRITAFVLCLLMLFVSTSFGYAEGEVIPETSTMPEMDALPSVTVDAEPEESAEADILAEETDDTISFAECSCGGKKDDYAGHHKNCKWLKDIRDFASDKDADAILAVWDSLDADTQTVMLAMLEAEDPEKFAALDTLIEESEHACDCEYPPESGNIADHVDSCKRKQYIKSLFEGKTAEEIYAGWNDLDSATQTDLLNMLKVWDSVKYEELLKLIGGVADEPGFPETTIDGITITVEAEEGVFPEGSTVSMTEVTDASAQIAAAKTALEKFFPDYIVDLLYSKVVDISFACNGEEVQPNGKVLLGFDIESIHSSAENIAILHITDDGTAELLALQNVYNTEAISLLIEAEHFSHYVILQSETTYKPTLLRDKLSGNSRYSIVEFPVTLNDIDAVAYNAAYDDTGLVFTLGNKSGAGMNLGGLPATQGIAAKYLSKTGYPVTHGSDRGEIIFGTGAASGKTVHEDVQFEFVYDNQT
ncbi:MAG: hypothetical protein IJ973_00880, partial [Christensenellaceae bacterium]|nr:hypothetical protein [Christensenellaceae bacterium]